MYCLQNSHFTLSKHFYFAKTAIMTIIINIAVVVSPLFVKGRAGRRPTRCWKYYRGWKVKTLQWPSVSPLANSNDNLMSRSAPECQWDCTTATNTQTHTRTQKLYQSLRFSHRNHSDKATRLTNRSTSKMRRETRTALANLSYSSTTICWILMWRFKINLKNRIEVVLLSRTCFICWFLGSILRKTQTSVLLL